MKLRIEQDVDPLNPRTEFDNVGIMVCFHKRYRLGDEHDINHNAFSSWDEIYDYLEKEKEAVHILPLYMYDHSGITIRTYPFECRWDSGQIGFIYTTAEKMKEEQIKEDEIEKILIGEVETYDQYVSGDVWGYIIEDDEGNHLESCWGFFGHEWAEQEGNDMLKVLSEQAGE